MIRRLLIAAILFLGAGLAATAQVSNTPPLWCQEGGLSAIVQGLASTSPVMVSMPSCTVTVYLTGTTTLATLYTNAILTPLSNPFTANADSSYAFYASTAQNYDIVTVGTTYCVPLLNGCSVTGTQTTTVTLANVSLQGAGGGGGGGGTITGATVGGGLVVSGTTLGLIITCSSGQSLVWNGTAWACGNTGLGASTSGQLLYNAAGAVAGVCSYDGVSNLTCVNLTATNLTINGSLTIAGAYFFGPSSNPSLAIACPAIGFTNGGVNNDHYFAECVGGSTLGDVLKESTVASPPGLGQAVIGATGTTPDTLSTTAKIYASVYQTGSLDACQALLAAESANLTYNGVIVADFRGDQKCSVSPWSFSYQGAIEFQTATYHAQVPWLLPRKNHVDGQGWETGSGPSYTGATVLQACSSGDTFCNSVIFPSNTQLACYSSDGSTCNFNNGPVFDSPILHFTFDCHNILGCTSLANYTGQEGSVPQYINYLGYGNGGVGLDIGGGGLLGTSSFVKAQVFQLTSCGALATPCTLTMPSGFGTAGDTIMVTSYWAGNTITLTSVTGTVNHGYTLQASTAASDSTSSRGIEMAYNQNVNIGPDTLTIVLSANATSVAVMVAEYTFIAPVGTVDSATTTFATANGGTNSCPAATVTANNNPLQLGDQLTCMAFSATSSGTWAAGTTSGCSSPSCNQRIGTAVFALEDKIAQVGSITPNLVSTTVARTAFVTVAFHAGTNNGPGGQNSGVYMGDFSISGGSTCLPSARAISLHTGNPGSAGPKNIDDITATGQGCTPGTGPNVEIDDNGPDTTWSNIHIENFGVAAFRIGQLQGTNANGYNNINSGNGSLAETFSISSCTESSFTATCTTTVPCDLLSGQPISTTGLTPSGYNTPALPTVTPVVTGCGGGSTFTFVLPASGLGTSGTGTVTVQNELVLISSANPNGTDSLVFNNLKVAAPGLPVFTLVDEGNSCYIQASIEPHLSFYAIGYNGSKFPGSGTGQNILTTSGQCPTQLWKVQSQLWATDYRCVAKFGDCQAGSSGQPPATTGLVAMPTGWTQQVVSSNAVTGNSLITLSDQSGPTSGAQMSLTCDTTDFVEAKVTYQQPPLVSPLNNSTYTAYPVLTVTSSSLTSNVVTLTGTFSGFGTPSTSNPTIIRHAGDSNSALNTLGLVTGGNGTTTLTYTLINSNTTGTGGTAQIVPGFAFIQSATASGNICWEFGIQY